MADLVSFEDFHALAIKKKKKKNSQMPRHLISDAHEWINDGRVIFRGPNQFVIS